ncbi:pilus assembly protein [Ruegeria sp. 2205SS24-7]|uniref:TadE/TadG family type IV pilus assembly protein n=1 Tax=Ruegeria discodermiae TaxID=3064389 RepID=UPI002742501A|nr:pilus assembly protein [Ruegeria sp. 2205SS24-7]MDP5216636.1 pilus assembly protein [Ruegeria sp. 2205SS24-7]
MVPFIAPRLKRFSKEENGAISVEALMMLPLLFWAFLAVFTFLDAYRANALNLKAAYTIGDLVSRETEVINNTYIDSMATVFGLMTKPGSESRVRISVVHYDEDTDGYYLDWSANRGFTNAMDDDRLAEIRDRLPIMPDEERVILVETSNTYVPPFAVGVNITDMENLVFTRPRFTGLVRAEL